MHGQSEGADVKLLEVRGEEGTHSYCLIVLACKCHKIIRTEPSFSASVEAIMATLPAYDTLQKV